MTFSHSTRLTRRVLLLFALVALAAPAALAEIIPPAPVNILLPSPSPNSFDVSLAFGPTDGLLYVWNGASVYRENAINSDSFTSIGNVGTGSADPGPIAFSRDSGALLIGNGFGGLLGGTHAGQLFSIPAAGGNSSTPVGNVPYHLTALASPLGASNTEYFINQGDASFTLSSVSLFDAASGNNQSIIANIPGASTSMAIDGGRLFVGVGYGAERGVLRSFALSDLQTAAGTATPLDWTAGQVFNGLDNNSGAGMFFDARGYLFVGGPNGLTVFNPSGQFEFYDNGGFTSVIYDSFSDRVFVSGFGNQQGVYPAAMFFNVPEPSTLALSLLASLALARHVWRRRRPALG